MAFLKYQHVERFGNSSVRDIVNGKCYVFPKIDGTNASIWWEVGTGLCFGSRNRQVTLENDNQGFVKSIMENESLVQDLHNFFLSGHNRRLILYGEFLVPHTLKTYRDEAWKQFYVFDVYDKTTNTYCDYEAYSVALAFHKYINVIPPIAIIEHGQYEDFIKLLDNTYLISDGEGYGEGIVIKRYDFVNQFGRTVWAKIVRNEFREKHDHNKQTPIVKSDFIEAKIIDTVLTQAFVEKEFVKIEKELGGWESKFIPRFLSTVWHEFINEELWDILKQFKNPTIDFKLLNQIFIGKVKEYKSDIF